MARVICQLFFTCSSRTLVPLKPAPNILSPLLNLRQQKKYSNIQYNFQHYYHRSSINKMSAGVTIPATAPVVEETEEENKAQVKNEPTTSNGKSEDAKNTSNGDSIEPSLSVESSQNEVKVEKIISESDEISTTSSNSSGTVDPSAETKPIEGKEDAILKKEAFLRLRKRKIVLMLSYCGQDYFGMQKNPGMKTIEEELFNSLLKNGYIDDETMKRPQVAQFQRAARTDKHVSAARQIVSFKGPEEVSIDKINEHLPPDIRVMGLKRVTKGFDAKNNCDARTYMYMIPTFAFAPIEVAVTEDYRISEERVAEVQKALNLYLGAKNYHNFTSRKRPNDPSARRMIYSFDIEKPFMKDGLEYCVLKVKGQSFMLHQIRKMIGLVVAYMRGFANLETFEKCWGAERIDIPKAPGLGLMLGYVHYTRYDKRFGSDGMHDSLTWDSQEDKVLQFCDEYIYPVVTKTENEVKSMMDWLSTIPFHTYDVRESGPPPTDMDEIRKRQFEADYGTSKIGKAFYKVGKVQGQLPHFSKKRHGAGADDDDDEEEESEEDTPKKARLQVEN